MDADGLGVSQVFSLPSDLPVHVLTLVGGFLTLESSVWEDQEGALDDEGDFPGEFRGLATDHFSEGREGESLGFGHGPVQGGSNAFVQVHALLTQG